MVYLNSNESLKLNETFKLYLTVFSIDHEHFKQVNGKKNKKRTRQFYQNKKIHVGCNNQILFKANWALDCPITFPKDLSGKIFHNKCLLICIVLGLLQHSYFENKIEHKAYLYVTQISSSNNRKQNHAGNILAKNLDLLIQSCNLPPSGPYELLKTLKIVSPVKKCQFFIFSGFAHKNKLELMYPENYDDSLKPIYLYHQYDSNHLIFIRNINIYFRANYRICFVCKKSFGTATYRHLCLKKDSCFSCRRYYITETTYYNSFIANDFCDRFVSKQRPFECPKCNLTIYSEHCLKGHRKLCYGKGHFGWKCNVCDKFFYRYNNETSDSIKCSHTCLSPKKCRYCFEPNTADHICSMRSCKYPKIIPRLAFLNVEFLNDYEPLLIILYLENSDERGIFKKYVFSNVPNYIPLRISDVSFCNLMPDVQWPNVEKREKKFKQDFKLNLERLNLRSARDCIKTQLLQIILAHRNVTIICQDENSKIMVLFLTNNF